MSDNPFAPSFETLPETLPIFPLTGVLLLPNGQLPLNIFEPRYLSMINDAFASHRMIGMIQAKEPSDGKNDVYSVGCAGKIIDFSETLDGRYEITLSGICRFNVEHELDATTPYRQVKPGWQGFKHDLDTMTCSDLDREKLVERLQVYFNDQELTCDWEAVENAPDNKLITCLSMVCPFEPQEKQALLEAKCCNERAKTFMTMLEMAVYQKGATKPKTSQH